MIYTHRERNPFLWNLCVGAAATFPTMVTAWLLSYAEGLPVFNPDGILVDFGVGFLVLSLPFAIIVLSQSAILYLAQGRLQELLERRWPHMVGVPLVVSTFFFLSDGSSLENHFRDPFNGAMLVGAFFYGLFCATRRPRLPATQWANPLHDQLALQQPFCPRCKQSGLMTAKLTNLGRQVVWCPGCDAIWLDESKVLLVRQVLGETFLDCATYLRSLGANSTESDSFTVVGPYLVESSVLPHN